MSQYDPEYEHAIEAASANVAKAIRLIMEGTPNDGPLELTMCIRQLIEISVEKLRNDIQDATGVRP